MNPLLRDTQITKEELPMYMGKRVRASQLKDVLDTYIVLTEVTDAYYGYGFHTFEGILSKVSDNKIWMNQPDSCLVYHNSIDRMEGTCFD